MSSLKIIFVNIIALLFLPIVAILLIISLILRITACAFISIIPNINKNNGWEFIIKAYNTLSNIYE